MGGEGREEGAGVGGGLGGEEGERTVAEEAVVDGSTTETSFIR